MKKYILLMILFFIAIKPVVNAQEYSNENEFPSFYSSVTIGGIELFSASVGKFVTDDISLAVKWSLFGVQDSGLGGPSTPASFGMGANYFFNKIFIFNYLSADYLYIYGSGYKGDGIEVVIGTSSRSEKGINFLFESGIGISNTDKTNLLLGPILKIGLNYNF